MIIEVRMYPEESDRVITYPITYKRKLTGIYYSVMEQAYGKKFAEMFHTNTGTSKMVALSDLFPHGKLVKNNVIVRGNFLKFYISSPNDSLVMPFLNVDEVVFLGKKWHTEAREIITRASEVKYFKTLSPVKITAGSKLYGVGIGSKEFWEILYKNFMKKYEVLFDDKIGVEFDVLSAKKRVVKIQKNGVVLSFDAYDLEFRVKNVDEKIVKSLEAGLGESNLMGFGFVLPIV